MTSSKSRFLATLKGKEGTPGHFTEEAISGADNPPWPLAQLQRPGGQRSKLTPPPCCRLHGYRTPGRVAPRYPRATTAAQMSHGSEKAKAPPNSAVPLSWLILRLSLQIVPGFFYQLPSTICKAKQGTIHGVYSPLFIVTSSQS